MIVGVSIDPIDGKPRTKTLALPLGEGASGRERLRSGGVTLTQLGTDLEIAAVKFGSRARKLGADQGAKITELKLPNPARPSAYWIFIPAFLLTAGVWMWQGRRASLPIC